MISRAQILRLAENKQYQRLLNRVLANGRPCSNAIRRRLAAEAVARPAALALAVQRFLELSYDSRSAEGDRLISRLVTQQHADGLFGSEDNSDDDRIAATAVAVRALMDYLATDSDTTVATSQSTQGSDMRFSAALALARAAQALVAQRAVEYCLGGDVVTAQIVEWQLGNGLTESSLSLNAVLDHVLDRVAADIQAMDPIRNPDTPGGLAEAA